MVPGSSFKSRRGGAMKGRSRGRSHDSSQPYQRPTKRGGQKVSAGKPSGYSVMFSGFSREHFHALKSFALNAIERDVVIVKQQLSNDRVTFWVKDKEDAQALLEVDGMAFKGKTLSVNFVSAVKSGSEQAELLKAFVRENYDSASKFLNLNNMRDQLMMHGVDVDFSRERFGAGVIAVINKAAPGVETISFGNNRIPRLAFFNEGIELSQTVKNLSFEDNDISSLSTFKSLQYLGNLNELIIRNNPCVNNVAQTDYSREIVEIFPKLKLLDGIELAPVITFDFGDDDISANHAVPDTQPFYFGTEVLSTFVPNFVAKYFKDIEGNQNITGYFTQSSCASHSTVSSYDFKWGSTMSRNHTANAKLSFNRKVDTLAVGPEEIRKLFKNRLRGRVNMDTLSCDAFPLSCMPLSLIMVSLVGDSSELNSTTKRPTHSFHRTLILAVANEEQKSRGIDACVLNDSLTVMEYNPKMSPIVPPEPSEKSAVDQTQDALILKLKKATNMTRDACVDCLTNSDWDYSNSLALYMRLKKQGALPLDYFQ